ncbi:response regulator transcription factor [Reyranella sp.]|uniref:response regulator transcription factor n=1 Tax=Reyranella sp. TaxID=1929291 RepID=UPI003D106ACD
MTTTLGRSIGDPEPVSFRSPNTTPLVAIIDDDEDVRTSLHDLLRSCGYSAELFETADSFLESASAARIDCVVSDVQMPGTSGLQLARIMQSRMIPIILITAFPTAEIAQQAAAAGVRRLLVKPFDTVGLIAELAGLLG